MPPTFTRSQAHPHPGGIFTLRHSPPGTHLLTGGADRNLRLHKTAPLSTLSTLRGHAHQILSATFSSTSATLLSAGGDRALFLWDAHTATLRRKLSGRHGHSHRVNDAVFAAPGDALVVSGSYDASVRVWDLRGAGGKPVQVLSEATDSVEAVLAPLGQAEVIAAAVDGCVRKYDLRRGECAVDTLNAAVGSLALSRDGNCVLAACLDDAMWLMDKATGEMLCQYKGHSNGGFAVQCAVMSDDGGVVCGSEDGRVCFWDIVEGSEPAASLGVGGELSVVSALDAHPTDSSFVCGTHDGRLVSWTSSSR